MGDACQFNAANQAASLHACSLLLVGMCPDRPLTAASAPLSPPSLETGRQEDTELCTNLRKSALKGKQRLDAHVREVKTRSSSSSSSKSANSTTRHSLDDADDAAVLAWAAEL